MKGGSKLLCGEDAITDHLKISSYLFRKFIRLKMPCVLIDKRWFAHTKNLDLYFERLTAKQGELNFDDNGEANTGNDDETE